MLLEGGLLHAQRRLQLQQTASMEMTSGQKLKTKKSQISCSRNYCQKITYYDIKLDGSIQKKLKILILNITAAAQQFLNQNYELILYYEK